MGVVLIVAIVIAFIISTAVTKKVANKIYILTGYNGFSGLHKTLCASVWVILVAVSLIFPDNLKLALLALVPIVILVVLNLKAKKVSYIVILSLLHVFYAVSWFLFFILKFLIQIVFRTNINSFSTELKPLEDATLERAEWVAKKNGYLDVNDWVAKESGYADAHAAYEAGFFSGKLY